MSKILIPLAQRCEELEAVTLIDLLRRARFEVVTAGLEAEVTPILAARGTRLLPDTTLEEALKQTFDMIVLPGGLPGADYLNQDARIINLLTTMARNDKYIAAICAAPRALVTAGLLAGKRATSYPGTLDKMTIPDFTFSNDAVVVDGKIITSRGPGTAMEFALTLIQLLGGEKRREEVEEPLLADG